MAMCTKALLRDPLPPLSLKFPICKNAQKTLKRVVNVQKKHWSCFKYFSYERTSQHLHSNVND